MPRSVETPGRTLPCRFPKDMSADVRNPVLMVGSRALSHEAEIPGTIDVLQSILLSRRRTKVVVGKWRASEKRKCKCRPLPWR